MKNFGKLKKWLAYIIPFMILVIFALILTSGSFLRAYYEPIKTIPYTINQLEIMLKKESWQQAEEKLIKLDKEWQKAAPLLQISTTEEDIKQISLSIARLKGYIKGEDLGSALAEVGIMRFIWSQHGS